MTVHLYVSLLPEALIASMIPPEEFGTYYAVGTRRKLHGQAIFLEIDPSFRHEFFRIEDGISRCVPHVDGEPKKSVYISTYRVLEHIPLGAVLRLYLVTAYGETLGIDRSDLLPSDDGDLHLYQEIAPVQPLVVSTLGPVAFYEFITQDPSSMIHLPSIAYADLRLGALARDPEFGDVGELPYAFIPHLRECLVELQEKTIETKMVDRVHPVEFPYRMIKTGIYIGSREELAYYPLPSRDELRDKYYRWWRSANLIG
jgi:hypothetical protein